MLSDVQSAKSALIFARLFCVPPVALPPGLLVLHCCPCLTPSPLESGELPTPAKLTVAAAAWAGANNMNAVGLVILSADIATFAT